MFKKFRNFVFILTCLFSSRPKRQTHAFIDVTNYLQENLGKTCFIETETSKNGRKYKDSDLAVSATEQIHQKVEKILEPKLDELL